MGRRQAEYEREEIDWSYIQFVDNQDVLDLIEGKMGIFDLLDEVCRYACWHARAPQRHLLGASCSRCNLYMIPTQLSAIAVGLPCNSRLLPFLRRG